MSKTAADSPNRYVFMLHVLVQRELDKAASNMAAVLQTWDAPGYAGTAREIEMTLQLLAAARQLTTAATAAAITEQPAHE